MARVDIGAFEKEFQQLCKKHKVHPAVVVYHPGDTISTRYDVTEIGYPSTEWIAQAGEAFLKHAENKILSGNSASAIEAFPEPIETKAEEHYTPSGLMQNLLKPKGKFDPRGFNPYGK
ncbi:MAG: hypothetical protein KGL39_19845 [Patescibacteria group bacterium]|nr:hypothetical protein [Patescibacteria group bacterium]